MRDVWRWWKVRKPQMKALLVLGLVLLWMSLNLWQTQRNFQMMMRSHERLVKQQETAGQVRLDRLIEAVEAHHAEQDLDAAALRDDLLELNLAIGRLIDQTGRETVR